MGCYGEIDGVGEGERGGMRMQVAGEGGGGGGVCGGGTRAERGDASKRGRTRRHEHAERGWERWGDERSTSRSI